MHNMKSIITLISLLITNTLCAGQTVDDWIVAQNFDETLITTATYKTQAEEGNAMAQFNLAQMYRMGRSVKKDFTTAIKWYKMSAAQGHELSQFNLGLMYFNRQGVKRDLVKAHMWLNLSAMAGADNAVKNKNLLAKEMTQDQIKQAFVLARECLAKEFKGCD